MLFPVKKLPGFCVFTGLWQNKLILLTNAAEVDKANNGLTSLSEPNKVGCRLDQVNPLLRGRELLFYWGLFFSFFLSFFKVVAFFFLFFNPINQYANL